LMEWELMVDGKKERFSGTLNTATETVALPGSERTRRKRGGAKLVDGSAFARTLRRDKGGVDPPSPRLPPPLGRFGATRRPGRPRLLQSRGFQPESGPRGRGPEHARRACSPSMTRNVFSGTLNTATETVALPGSERTRRKRS
jgi:hypothetical protein